MRDWLDYLTAVFGAIACAVMVGGIAYGVYQREQDNAVRFRYLCEASGGAVVHINGERFCVPKGMVK